MRIPRPVAVPAVLLVAGLIWAGACGGDRGAAPDDSADAGAGGSAPQGTPVQVGTVERSTMVDEVSAPGQTVALVEQKVRAPFDGTIAELAVVEGNPVRRGERIGSIVARDSEAALEGAQEMARRATTPAARDEASRALELAREHRVTAPLLATVSGRVTQRSASAGDRVTSDQDLVTIVAADSLVFRAQVPQSELASLRPGAEASIDLAGSASPVAAHLRSVLAADAGSDLTAPVRLDFDHPLPDPVPGLFGTARIVVARHRDAQVVPLAAVLRDDVSGTSRVGTFTDEGKLHWVQVETGLEDSARIEIRSPELAVGTRVVLSGQVGLPEGTPLAIRP